MLKVFNISALTQKQRFGNAILFGSLASLALTLIYYLINAVLEIEFLYTYLAIGYLIGLVIQKTGRGVQTKFSILAAVLCLLVIFFGDFLTIFNGMFFSLENILHYFRLLAMIYGEISTDVLWSVGVRVVAVYLAWQTARVI